MLLARLSFGEKPEVMARQALEYVLSEYPAMRQLLDPKGGDDWRRFVAAALPIARESGNEQMLADLLQMKALYERVSPPEFTPFPQGFFEDRRLPHFLRQLDQLPEQIVSEAVRRGHCAWWGNPSRDSNSNSIPVLLGRVGLYVSSSRSWWAQYGYSAIWMRTSFRYRVFAGFTKEEMSAVRKAFSDAAPESTSLVGDGEFGIPILIRENQPEAAVLDSAVRQVGQLRSMLDSGGLTIANSR